jgi:hypothetical protein
LRGNLYLQLFYQQSLRVSERVMNREIFFHAEISLLSVKRLHSQQKQDLRIRTGKCVDSSEGSMVAIAGFTVIVMCFVLHTVVVADIFFSGVFMSELCWTVRLSIRPSRVAKKEIRNLPCMVVEGDISVSEKVM